MRIKDIINEGGFVQTTLPNGLAIMGTGAAKANSTEIAAKVIETKFEHYLEHHPYLEKLVAATPSAKEVIQSLLEGKVTVVALTTLIAAIIGQRAAPEFHQLANWLGTSELIRNLSTRVLGQAIAGLAISTIPAEIMLLPWMMAGHERTKIDADPWNKAFDNIPYAMVARGQAKTQGQAGAMNARSAVKNFSTAGNPVPPQAGQVESLDDIRRLAGQ